MGTTGVAATATSSAPRLSMAPHLHRWLVFTRLALRDVRWDGRDLRPPGKVAQAAGQALLAGPRGGPLSCWLPPRGHVLHYPEHDT